MAVIWEAYNYSKIVFKETWYLSNAYKLSWYLILVIIMLKITPNGCYIFKFDYKYYEFKYILK